MSGKGVLTLIVVLLAVGAGAGLMRDARINSDFASVQAKSGEPAVRRLLGNPAKISQGCDAYGTTVAPDCDRVFIYRSIFYPARERYWLVFFDKNQQVTATSSQVEP